MQSFGTEWWTRQWIGALEAIGWENRLERGRTYARTGRVRTLEVQPGTVKALVMGSQPQPYRVTIGLETFPASEWQRLLDLIAQKARYAGQLLAGEMPEDIDEIFDEVGRSLFPRARTELRTNCSCPDFANPCKHIAAVHYMLGARFDTDPFVLFLLRGMPRERLLHEIRQRRHVPDEQAAVAPELSVPESRPVTLSGFHGHADAIPEGQLAVEASLIDPAAFGLSLPRSLGTDARLLEALAQVARRAALASREQM